MAAKKSWQETLFTTNKITIKLPSLKTPFKLIPFGDVHYYSPHCDQDRFHTFLDRCKRDDDEYTRYLTLGDLDDMMSASERGALDGKIHESSEATLDNFVLSQTTNLLDKLWFMKGRVLGMIEGNHHWKFRTGDLEGKTNTQYMANRLGAKFLGGLSVMRLCFKFENTSKKACVDIIMAHGKAGGKLAGTSINQLEDMRRIFPLADIYIFGHDHKRGCWPDSALQITSGNGGGINIKQKRQWFVRSGSFLRGFVDGQSTYAVGSLYKPTELGTVRIEIGFSRDRKNGKDIISTDIHTWS